jgi:hypothetical protein
VCAQVRTEDLGGLLGLVGHEHGLRDAVNPRVERLLHKSQRRHLHTHTHSLARPSMRKHIYIYAYIHTW